MAGSTTYIYRSALVSNCVLTANTSTGNGGGAFYVNMINCTLSGNKAISGGGAYNSALINCAVIGNSAQTNVKSSPIAFSTPGVGGGLCAGSAVNCLIAGNSAFNGGGTYDVTSLANCTIVNNTAGFDGGVSVDNALRYAFSDVTNCIIYYEQCRHQ